jgi:hypothetical protein
MKDRFWRASESPLFHNPGDAFAGDAGAAPAKGPAQPGRAAVFTALMEGFNDLLPQIFILPAARPSGFLQVRVIPRSG